MQRLEVSGAVRPLWGLFGVKGLIFVAVAEFCLPCNLASRSHKRACL